MSRDGGRERRKWERAVREHRTALSAFAQAAAGLNATEWERSPGEGRWRPAEIVEHLALVYEAVLRELREGEAMAPRVTPARQAIFRWFLLPHMLFHRTLPRVRAPRETRPASWRPERGVAVERFRGLGEETEAALSMDPSAMLTHPYFGPLDRSRTLRLIALHIEHHRRQLPTP